MADGSFDIRKVISQIRKVFEDLTTMQKSMVISFVAVLLIFMIGLAVYNSQEPMGILYTELEPKKTYEVVEELKKQGVKYEISSDNTMIRVPSKMVGLLRLRIAGEGLFTENETVGFEKLESPGLTTTDFTLRTQYKNALENNMAKTLRDGLPHLITGAKVLITPAKDSIFISDKEDSKASVMLFLKAKRIPPEENVKAIMSLVASYVEGLRPENVVVTDQYARILSNRETPGDVTEAQNKMQRDEENYLVQKVREVLVPVVGDGKVVVSAKVELDFDKVQINEDKFDPQSQIERSTETYKEKSVKREPPLGIPGTPTNVPPADATAQGWNIWESKDIDKATTNFEITRIKREVEKSPGSTKRVTVSVSVDHQIVDARTDKGGWERSFAPWSNEDLDKFRALAQTAVGYDQTRGDRVTVENFRFAPTTNPQEEAEEAERQHLYKLISILAPLVIILIGVIGWIVYKIITREKPAPVLDTPLIHVEEVAGEEMIEPPAPPKTLAELKAEIEQEINAEQASQAPEAQRREVIKQRVTEIIAGDPETAASLVRTWLIEEDGGK